MKYSERSFTICICTYNRATRLTATLENMNALNIKAGLKCELLVIDNNSTDETKSVIKKFDNKLPLRYVFEERQGLSHARNRAIMNCRTDILLFTDDDMRIDSSWLNEFIKASIEFPEADYFGGRIIPYWPNSRPSWVKDENLSLLSGILGTYDLGSDIRSYTFDDPNPHGGNFAISRRLFARLDPFRVDLGMKGRILGRGEETEYISRAKEQKFKGVYVGTAICYHWVDSIRLKLRYIYRFGVQKGIAERQINPDHDFKESLFQEILYGVKGLYQLAKGRGDRFRQCIINMGIQRGRR